MKEVSHPSLSSLAYCTEEKKLLSLLDSSKHGLKLSKVHAHREKYGSNMLKAQKETTWFEIFLRQFNIITVMLLLSSVIAYIASDLIDAIGILAAALISVLFGFIQEYKAENSLKELQKLTSPKATVIRDGEQRHIDSQDIVVGDILLLNEGDLVPADCRILYGDVNIDQSALTGESHSISKTSGTLKRGVYVASRSNIVYAGTLVVKGYCKAVVFSVGKNTEFGKIAHELSEVQSVQTPLQKNLDELGNKMVKASVALAGLFFVVGMLRGEELVNLLIVSVALFVAAIPEGLPTVLAITLAFGVYRMAEHKALVRKMQSVETMGSATVICTDKTGTLTENKMSVVRFESMGVDYQLEGQAFSSKSRFVRSDGEKLQRSDKDRINELLTDAVLCINAKVSHGKNRKNEYSGDPTEIAMILAAEKQGLDHSRLHKTHKKIGGFEFGHKRKRMSQIRQDGKDACSYVKGAPEIILARCSHFEGEDGKVHKLTRTEKRRLEHVIEIYSLSALRTLAVAKKPLRLKKSYKEADAEKDLVFIGLLGLFDPPRPEAKDAIMLSQKAGIKVIMLTGDAAKTAEEIAKNLGLIKKKGSVITGDTVEKLSDHELSRIVKSISVCARATPEHKFRIIKALQKNGEIVAVTGDGVNDAPSIKRADIGIAMGVGGTDVARGAADMILTDNNFDTLVKAIERGRSIFSNIHSFVRFQFTTNVAALFVMFCAPLLNLPLPLNPLQILWINIIMDGPPALALGVEPSRKNSMDSPPRDPRAPFLSRNLLLSVFSSSFVMVLITLSIFTYYVNNRFFVAGTMAFTVFVMLQLVNALNCRNSKSSALSSFFSNKALVFALLFSFVGQIGIIHIKGLHPIFKTVFLEFSDWAIVFIAALALLAIEELKKRAFPRLTDY